MKKVLTIGGAMHDIFMHYHDNETLDLHAKNEEHAYVCLEAGKKIELEKISYYCGGGAINSAVSFARQDFAVAAFCKVGTDPAADFILKTLEHENVSTKNIIKSSNAATGTSFILPAEEGNSVVLINRAANSTITITELPDHAIAHSDQLYITSLSGTSAKLIAPLTALAKKYNKPVATNPGTSQLKAGAHHLKTALPNIDILILNSSEAELLMNNITMIKKSDHTIDLYNDELPPLLTKTLSSTNTSCFTLMHFFEHIHNSGPKIIVVTDGAQGVYVSDSNAIYYHPSIPTAVVSSIGAGDAFASCFVAQLCNQHSIEDALRAGVINSSSVLEHLDTQTGLLTPNEIHKRLQKLNKSLLKTYRLNKKEG